MCKPKSEGGLGFRNIEAFNQALLAKQSWRLLKNPDLLVAHVFKARYFPFTNFLNSNVGYNPSFVWRSLHRVKRLLEKGLYWSIGSGRRVSVYGDKWLPRPSSFKEVSPPILHEEAKVADLILENGHWNLDLIKKNF